VNIKVLFICLIKWYGHLQHACCCCCSCRFTLTLQIHLLLCRKSGVNKIMFYLGFDATQYSRKYTSFRAYPFDPIHRLDKIKKELLLFLSSLRMASKWYAETSYISYSITPHQNPEELQHQLPRGESLAKCRKNTDFVVGLRSNSCILSTG